MRFLGLDLGTKTCGVSISDITKTIATTYKTINFSDYDSLLRELGEIIKQEQIVKIVLGLPKNMNNSLGNRAQTTIEFGDLLKEEFSIELIYQDERLTTRQAESYMIKADVSRKKRKKKIDSLAANIILQSYLDKKEGN